MRAATQHRTGRQCQEPATLGAAGRGAEAQGRRQAAGGAAARLAPSPPSASLPLPGSSAAGETAMTVWPPLPSSPCGLDAPHPMVARRRRLWRACYPGNVLNGCSEEAPRQSSDGGNRTGWMLPARVGTAPARPAGQPGQRSGVLRTRARCSRVLRWLGQEREDASGGGGGVAVERKHVWPTSRHAAAEATASWSCREAKRQGQSRGDPPDPGKLSWAARGQQWRSTRLRLCSNAPNNNTQ